MQAFSLDMRAIQSLGAPRARAHEGVTSTMPKPQGTTMTTLYDLGNASVDSFDEFRRKRGIAPYFHNDENGGVYNVNSSYGPYLDRADLDELDRAFLLG